MSDTECHICCEKYLYLAKYRCSHKICYKCATRLIYLYGDMRCPMCKYESQKPIFEKSSCEESVNEKCCWSNKENDGKIENSSSEKTTNLMLASTDELSMSLKTINLDRPKNDDGSILNNDLTAQMWNKHLMIEDGFAKFKNDEVHQKVRSLLLIKCKECRQQFNTKKELMTHFKSKHSSLLCGTCLENNHQFWYEYFSYTPETLSLHRKGQLKESGFDGHVHCPFCSFWIYNKDLAKKHCNEEHQLCTVCDSMGVKFQFYRNFSELETHFRSKHYCCDNPVCVKNHCYVYAYKSEICAHSLAHHGLEMQLNDVCLKNEKNPTVFSLHDSRARSEEESLYTRGVNILNPLINEPFFPSFNQSNISRDSSSVPSFLNRQIVHQAQTINSQRVNILKDISPNFYNEISQIIEKYISGIKPLTEMIAEIEECVGKETCLRIIGRVPFLQKQKEISQFSVEYKKELKFPSFKKSIPKVDEAPQQPNKRQSFRVIDLTKK
ncbi:uncharacterized protein VICG_01222 [Vittaforma corneae ATCC 50505]|uniref:RING-type domain-containing protein n=1 Tax=Vittaforma corneae (strain ATCC 50505) TaxID=993615 RepID=L2GLF9_VITCO|nr:uncharacterized protein VICG_01222 [Vittaforma corneae ATCC 50505]ELA41718.1 hypothetical protein VICG_01222 [Vittaforma corneae ATCC 50505]